MVFQGVGSENYTLFVEKKTIPDTSKVMITHMCFLQNSRGIIQ